VAGDHVAVLFQREVATVEQVQLCFRQVALKGASALYREEGIVLPSSSANKGLRLSRALLRMQKAHTD
jgi:hypothetical protein